MSDELINELARAIEHGLAYDVEIDVRASETCIEERRCIAARMLPTIRDYGDKRYQQAIADVVEWLRAQQHGRTSDNYPGYYARQIEQRFGKDA